MCVKTIMKNIRKALAIGVVVACIALVLFLALRGLRKGGLPSWTPGPDFTTVPSAGYWGETMYPEDLGGYEYEYEDDMVPAVQMPTTVPTVVEPSPAPLGIPFILPTGASSY